MRQIHGKEHDMGKKKAGTRVPQIQSRPEQAGTRGREIAPDDELVREIARLFRTSASHLRAQQASRE
eukprot:2015908-Pleurochrysis_carterae.AAC.1